VVEGGIQVYWAQHLQEFSQSTEPLKTLFPEGGFALHGNSKVFGSVGIALALYFTAAPENRVKVAGLLIPATLTAMLVGLPNRWSSPSCLSRRCCLPFTRCWRRRWRR
jgi:PTS system arbutin-like IIC component